MAIIDKNAFTNAWGHTWSDSHSSENLHRYVYICAAAWYLVMNGHDGVWSDTNVYAKLYYYNGSGWTYLRQVGTSGGHTAIASHNRLENNGPVRCDNNYPLWCIEYWYTNGKAKHWNIKVWAGGYGVAKDTAGNSINYPSNKKIYSIGRACTPSGNIHTQPNAVAGDSDVVNKVFNWTLRQGASITGVTENELVNYPYLP